MAQPVILPRQGQSVESCIITQWHVKAGDSVAVGDKLFSYETDKAAFDEAAKIAGTVLALLCAEGDDMPCLSNICVIGAPGEDVSAFASGEVAAGIASAKVESAAETAIITQKADLGKISPRAKRLMESSGADMSQVSASGPDNRVIARDVQAVIDAGKVISPAARDGFIAGTEGTGIGGRVRIGDKPAKAAQDTPKAVEYIDKPLPNIRKIIARTMHESLSTMAQLTHNLSFDATEILKYRALIKAQGDKSPLAGVTLNDMILFAVSRTLKRHDALNAHYLGDNMRYFEHVHLGMATDTVRGLMVPTIFCADTLSLKGISIEAKRVAKACKDGNINPDELSGGTFTVSNLGFFGIETFTPVINPPQTGILGVNTIVDAIRIGENGAISGYKSMALSLTYDHRALDGAPASRFLKDLSGNLERFTLLLAEG